MMSTHPIQEVDSSIHPGQTNPPPDPPPSPFPPGAAPSGTAPGTEVPPLPFDPTVTPPQPPTQSDLTPAQPPLALSDQFRTRARKALLVAAAGLGILMLASWMRGGVYITNETNEVPLPTQMSTSSALPNVPARALPVGATIGGYPVRRSALMIMNGDVTSVQSAVLDTLGRNPGVGICQLYIGAAPDEVGGVVIVAARTTEAEVALVDCSGSPAPSPTVTATATATTATTTTTAVNPTGG